MKQFGSHTFLNCYALEKIEIDEENQNFSFVNGILLNRDRTEMVYILASAISEGQTVFEIPYGIVKISTFEPADIKDINKMVIPKSVTSINFSSINKNVREIEVNSENEYYCSENGSVYSKDKTALCFYSIKIDGSDNLKEITIPEGITTIRKHAFRQCSNVEKIDLPHSLTTIESEGISTRTNLTEVNVKENVSNIGPLAFYSCSKLINLNIDSSNPYYMVEGQGIYNKDKTLLVGTFGKIIGTFEVPYGVEIVGEFSIHNQKEMTAIILPETLKEIKQTFSYCSGLTTITIPNSVNKIHTYTFNGTDNLSEIIIDNYHFTDSSKKTPTIPGEPWGCKYGARAITWLRGEHP